MYTVYLLTAPNGKRYVGVTNDLPHRLSSHLWSAKSGLYNHLPLYRAINKYGWELFTPTILSTHKTRADAAQEEIQQIALLGTRDPEQGYNVTLGGEGSPRRFCKRGHDKLLVGAYRGQCKACRQDANARVYADPVKRAKRTANNRRTRKARRSSPEYVEKVRSYAREYYSRDPSTAIARVDAWRKAKRKARK